MASKYLLCGSGLGFLRPAVRFPPFAHSWPLDLSKNEDGKSPFKKSCSMFMSQHSFISWSCCDKLPRSGDLKQWKYVISQVFQLEVQSQGVASAVLPGESVLALPSFEQLQACLGWRCRVLSLPLCHIISPTACPPLLSPNLPPPPSYKVTCTGVRAHSESRMIPS